MIIESFSRWVEAFPSKHQGAATVVKFLTNEVIPRFRIPTEISSDNGSAFVNHAVKFCRPSELNKDWDVCITPNRRE